MPDLITLLDYLWIGIEVALGVGFVIFVHELGHFAVAKLCGVKCDKFYLGFDIGGWKFCKFHWGETEYGIGILPLGGYVKMLGQEDNPAKLKEEIERAKLQQADAADSSQPTANLDLAEAEQALYNPRSYLAKSVPKRIAIILAGVIMNVIFAFLMAAAAYAMGVEQIVCAVGEVFPGEAAWRAGLQPGDHILEIAGKKAGRIQDLQKYIAVGDIDHGVPMLIERPGEKDLLKLVVHPDRFQDIPSIGLINASTLVLRGKNDKPPVMPGSAAAKAEPPLHGGDRIVAIDGEKIENFRQLQTYLANHPGNKLNLTLDCTVPGERGAPASTKLVDAAVPPQPMRTLGLVMAIGEIAALQDGSPAERAGLRPHDRILEIDGAPVDDPLRLPDLFRRIAGKKIVLTVQRGENKLEIPVTPHKTASAEQPYDMVLFSFMGARDNVPISISQLGIAYRVLNRVERVLPGSPADEAGIRPGAIIHRAGLIPPDTKKAEAEKADQESLTFTFDEKHEDWPAFFLTMQVSHPDTRIELELDGDRKVELQSVEAADWFNPNRGFRLEPETHFQKADSLGEAARLGANETWDGLTMVVQMLHRMGSRQVSPKALGGPFSIIAYAYQSAKRGFPTFLLFLTMLSANLAVLNVLPIPMLDGGHLVFLTYEGIRGKPANEHVQIVLSIIGLIMLLGLMVFVIGLDINRLRVLFFGK